jgi:hypothetical protein
MGKSEITDTIFKLPEAKQNNGALETVHNKNNIKVGQLLQRMESLILRMIFL